MELMRLKGEDIVEKPVDLAAQEEDLDRYTEKREVAKAAEKESVREMLHEYLSQARCRECSGNGMAGFMEARTDRLVMIRPAGNGAFTVRWHTVCRLS